MTQFIYQARESSGQLANGVVAAASVEEAGRQLRSEGKYVVKISEQKSGQASSSKSSVKGSKKKVKRDEVIRFSHQLYIMLETGGPLTDALDCVVQQTEDEAFMDVLGDVTQRVQAGETFSSSMQKYPKVFPNVMVSLIKASEVSGTMALMLERISAYLGKEQKTRKQVKGALTYPCFMVSFGVMVTVFLLIFVLPRFAAIYDTRGAALPGPTRFLMAISSGAIDYWYLCVAAVAALIGGIVFMSKTTAGNRCFDWLKLNIPIIKKLFCELYITRACRTMGTMINAGVSMLDTVAVVRDVTNNSYYADLWDEVDDRLRQGSQLSDPLFASSLIPRSVAQMIFSGEKSGRLGQVLEKIAAFTEEDFDTTVKTTTQFIEPLMISAMGGMIGFVAIALLLPIFSVSSVVAG